MASDQSDSDSWIDDFHLRAQEEENERLRVHNDQLKLQTAEMTSRNEALRQEIEMLRAERNQLQRVPSPERKLYYTSEEDLGGDRKNVGSSTPDQEKFQRGASAEARSVDRDRREYQQEMDMMKLTLVNNVPDDRSWSRARSAGRRRPSQRDASCDPLEDLRHCDMEMEQLRREMESLKQKRNECSLKLTELESPRTGKEKDCRSGSSGATRYETQTRYRREGPAKQDQAKQQRQRRRSKTKESSDTESLDSDEEGTHHHEHRQYPWKLRREDCVKGAKNFRSRFDQPRQKQMTPETFTGEAPLQEYLGQFESVATWNGWSERQKAQQLFMVLRGRARGVIRQQDEWKTITYTELVTRLESMFSGQSELYLAQLRGRQQQVQEGIQEFAQGIRKLTDNAYSGMAEEARNRIARDHFMSNLRDREIRSAVHLSRPTSMEEAVRTALETEAFLTSERAKQSTKFTRSIETSKGLEDQLSEVITLLKDVAGKHNQVPPAEHADPYQDSTDQIIGSHDRNDSGRRKQDECRRNYQNRGGRRSYSGQNRGCFGCGSLDHYVACCPNAHSNTDVNPGNPGRKNPGNEYRPNRGAQGGSPQNNRAPKGPQ